MMYIKALFYLCVVTVLSVVIAACSGSSDETANANTLEESGEQTVANVTRGKLYYENKLCYACHGNRARGGPSGIAIYEKTASDIMVAIESQMVHSGIPMKQLDAMDLAMFLADPVDVEPLTMDAFSQPEVCAICHPRQYQQWQGSMMRYGAISPVFSALELFANKLPGPGHPEGGNVMARLPAYKDLSGNVDPDRQGDLFCQSCHNPIDAARPYPDPDLVFEQVPSGQNPFPVMRGPEDTTPNVVRPLADYATPLGKNGISCDFCHQVTGPSDDVVLPAREGDGIANVSLRFEGGIGKQGPNFELMPNPLHGSVRNTYLSSSDFCGGCHDVRIPVDDQGTAEPDAMRLENLFTEWQQGPYGPAPNGNDTSCQDCHMSLFPSTPPGNYPQDIVSVFPSPDMNIKRRVSTHYFTGVDVALIEAYPGQEPQGFDSQGMPIGQIDRRAALLKAAASMELRAPASIRTSEVLTVTVDVRNKSAGHNIPSGFSQERQMWVELHVTDARGIDIYKSGHLVDSAHPETGEFAPDGSLHDEDLQDVVVTLDPVLGNTVEIVNGADYNRRKLGINKGLVNFANEFVSYDDATGREVEEFLPFAAEHMNNSNSIPPLQTRSNQYDIQLPAGITGPVTVRARLLFRAFPPRFLRFLAQRTAEFNLIDEALVDRNKIVEMVGPITTSVTLIQ